MRKSVLLVAVLATACRPGLSIPKETPLALDDLPGPTVFSGENALLSDWSGPLKSEFESAPDEQFKGVDGVAIHYRVFGRGRPNVVILIAGRTEPIMKYAETIHDLVGAGFGVYAMDVRGQGASGRMLPNPQKGHVVSFQDYVSDVDTLMQTVVKKDAPAHVMLLAHSMGGAIAVLYADQHPEELTALALSAPMLEINTGSFPPSVASSLGASACSASDGSAYAIGYGDYEEDTDFSKDTVTGSQPRWAWKQQLAREFPEQRIGGITWHWFCEAMTGSSRAAQLGRFSPVPTLLLQAAGDTVVKPAAQKSYCADAPRCQLMVMEGSKHEILQERDLVRNLAMARIVKFFDARSAP